MVDLTDLVPGAIAIARDGRIAIITEIKPSNTKYPVIYSFKTDAKGYKGNESDFIAVLGVVEIDVWNSNKPAAREKFRGTDSNFMVPDELKGVKIGDTIEIRSRRGTEKAIYRGYNPNCPKNCLSIEIGGKQYKGPLSLFVSKVS